MLIATVILVAVVVETVGVSDSSTHTSTVPIPSDTNMPVLGKDTTASETKQHNQLQFPLHTTSLSGSSGYVIGRQPYFAIQQGALTLSVTDNNYN